MDTCCDKLAFLPSKSTRKVWRTVEPTELKARWVSEVIGILWKLTRSEDRSVVLALAVWLFAQLHNTYNLITLMQPVDNNRTQSASELDIRPTYRAFFPINNSSSWRALDTQTYQHRQTNSASVNTEHNSLGRTEQSCNIPNTDTLSCCLTC